MCTVKSGKLSVDRRENSFKFDNKTQLCTYICTGTPMNEASQSGVCCSQKESILLEETSGKVFQITAKITAINPLNHCGYDVNLQFPHHRSRVPCRCMVFRRPLACRQSSPCVSHSSSTLPCSPSGITCGASDEHTGDHWGNLTMVTIMALAHGIINSVCTSAGK